MKKCVILLTLDPDLDSFAFRLRYFLFFLLLLFDLMHWQRLKTLTLALEAWQCG